MLHEVLQHVQSRSHLVFLAFFFLLLRYVAIIVNFLDISVAWEPHYVTRRYVAVVEFLYHAFSSAVICQSFTQKASFFRHAFHQTVQFVLVHCTWFKPKFISRRSFCVIHILSSQNAPSWKATLCLAKLWHLRFRVNSFRKECFPPHQSKLPLRWVFSLFLFFFLFLFFLSVVCFELPGIFLLDQKQCLR